MIKGKVYLIHYGPCMTVTITIWLWLCATIDFKKCDAN